MFTAVEDITVIKVDKEVVTTRVGKVLLDITPVHFVCAVLFGNVSVHGEACVSPGRRIRHLVIRTARRGTDAYRTGGYGFCSVKAPPYGP